LANKRKKKFPFKYGQRVRTKKTNFVGVVVSHGPATIGHPDTCRIPGGPLVLGDYVYVRFRIKGEYKICIQKIDELEKI